jgi:hypothetical protein
VRKLIPTAKVQKELVTKYWKEFFKVSKMPTKAQLKKQEKAKKEISLFD